ncbi:hypothetical protein DPEC_G00112660 [Dallia pectoralis]|uniref:Uncharacterized protein n=1 Tax=Dallia pectoralis TaxID=75939 RepID=A0ACC2GTE3_DALPE|nr:hypothetical protein DPEC_G00112660 [Dallia pectoralis]
MNIKGAFISWPVHINSLPQVPEAIMITGASILLLAGVLANDKDLHWQNEFDKPLEFTCPLGQSISGIESEHRNKNEDRRWNFACQATFDQTTSCATSPFINDFDEPFTYQCPYNQVITGMSSYHDNKHGSSPAVEATTFVRIYVGGPTTSTVLMKPSRLRSHPIPSWLELVATMKTIMKIGVGNTDTAP